MTDRICVAQIGAAHGIRGEVRLRSFTEDPAAITAYGPLESEDGTRRFTIEALRPAKDHFVARLAGVADRDAAEKLTNLKLYVARDKLPPIDEDDTFYHADLVGLVGGDAGRRGVRHGDGGSEFRRRRHARDQAGSGEHLLLPFTDTTVPKIDMQAPRHGRRAAHNGRVASMWRATVLTLFPEMFPGPLGLSLAGKALASGLWSLDAHDIRAHATDKHGTVDDTPAGGGPGMVMKADVLARAIDAAAGDNRPRLLMSARGAPLTQARAAALAEGPMAR